MSDDEENHISSYNENNEINLNIEEIEQNKPILKEKIGKGSDILHILPAKLQKQNNAIKAPVDKYFESNIINENASLNEYICYFRGRKLNGKKYKVPENINLEYYELLKEKKKEDYTINQSKDIKEYYIWKYDENIKLNEPMTNIEKTLKNFDFLA
jgi:hypothetical protein